MTTATAPSPQTGEGTDALLSAIAAHAADVARAAHDITRAAAGEDLSTLQRAEALCGLAAVRERLESMLDRLHGFAGVLPDDGPSPGDAA